MLLLYKKIRGGKEKFVEDEMRMEKVKKNIYMVFHEA